MKPENYNPKAREAFGKSLIDIGVGIFKGIMLLFTVAPLTFMLKGAVDGTNKNISLADLFAFMSTPAYSSFLVILAAAFLVGHYFRKEGYATFMRLKIHLRFPASARPNFYPIPRRPTLRCRGRCMIKPRSVPDLER